MAATLERSPRRTGAGQREIAVAIAHQKGGVGKSTSTALLAAEIAWMRPELTVLVEDLDPDLNLTSRWPCDTENVRLVRLGEGEATRGCSRPARGTPTNSRASSGAASGPSSRSGPSR